MHPGYYFAWMSGTSAATPHVAGVAALIMSINKKLSASEVRAILDMTAFDLGLPGYDGYFGFGLVDAYKACLITQELSTSLKVPL